MGAWERGSESESESESEGESESEVRVKVRWGSMMRAGEGEGACFQKGTRSSK